MPSPRRLGPALALSLAALKLITSPSFLPAEVRLPHVLSSHAVLQRDRPIHIWGWSDPSEKLSVTFHTQTIQTTADDLGLWSAWLAPEPAGGPYILVVNGSSKVQLEDLLVGDVWFASGQSNMEMPLKGFTGQAVIKDSAREIASATHPRIRLLRLEHRTRDFPLDDEDAQWTECSPATAADFSAVAYFFGREISDSQQVPVGLIDSTWGGTPIESWMSLDSIAADPSLMPLFATRASFVAHQAQIPLQQARERRETEAAAKEHRPAPTFPWHPDPASWAPAYLFNAMVGPVTPYTVRGFLWYQGETNSNPERAPLYHRLLPTMIRDWRSKWGEGDLPFLFVQISSFDSPKEDWGMVRDAQRLSLAVPNTAMAVSLDIGDPRNVHPPDKQTVGHRLALAADALTYSGHAEFSGPLFRFAQVEQNGIRLWFDHAHGLTTHGVPQGFEIAGTDGRYVDAKARVDGETVFVWSDAVTRPATVRYGWANVTPANLYNDAGLPASTFVTKEP